VRLSFSSVDRDEGQPLTCVADFGDFSIRSAESEEAVAHSYPLN